MSSHRKAFRFRLDPTAEQAATFRRYAGARRWVWNWALRRRKEYYGAHGKSIPKSVLSGELTELKRQPEMAWLTEIQSQVLQQPLADLDRAFVNFFEGRARYPKFKRKKSDRARFRFPQSAKVDGSRVFLPKVGWVAVRLSRPVDLPIKSATVKQDAKGHWHVTLVATFELPDVAPPKPREAKTVGLDLGLIDYVTFSDKKDAPVPAPQFFRRRQRKLRRAQRTFSRTAKGSKRRGRAKARVARVQARAADQRRDFQHQLSTRIINKFDGVCVETLNVRGLARTKLAKSFSDAAFGEFIRQLEYKAEWDRKAFAAVDRFFPSSKMCRECGTINDRLTLSDRVWGCSGCGAVHDRDLNAANNIFDAGWELLAVGHTERRNARGDGIRPATAGRRR